MFIVHIQHVRPFIYDFDMISLVSKYYTMLLEKPSVVNISVYKLHNYGC